jgi:hypothetical protein
MLVPPTSLLITQAAIDQIPDEATARFYCDELHWRIRNAIVVDDEGNVVHGELFVAAALYLGWQAVRVTHISEYTPMANPCAEIPIGTTEVCNLSTIQHRSPSNNTPSSRYGRPYPSATPFRPGTDYDRRG